MHASQKDYQVFPTETVLDTTQTNRTLVNLNVGGTKEAVLSNIRFTSMHSIPINGITGAVEKGINVIDDDFKSMVQQHLADTLINAQGVKKNASPVYAQQMQTLCPNGTITTINNGGITVGP